MNKISKQLIKIAREITALDEEGDGSGFQMFHDQNNFEQNQLDIAEKQGKKYILHHKEGRLWRIQACKNFGHVQKGDFGGLIESEKNLSHDGICWVFNTAIVRDNAQIYGNAFIADQSQVCGNAKVYDSAIVNCNAFVTNNAQVYEWSHVQHKAQVYDKVKIYGYAVVGGDACICGNARIHGHAYVTYNVKDQEITE